LYKYFIMATFTSTLPDYLLQLLDRKAQELHLPKNKLIEKALKLFLEQLNKAEYARSYRQLADDTDILSIVEEGMADYYLQLEKE